MSTTEQLMQLPGVTPDFHRRIQADYEACNADTDIPRWLNVVSPDAKNHVIDIARSCFTGDQNDRYALNEFLDRFARRWYVRKQLFPRMLADMGMEQAPRWIPLKCRVLRSRSLHSAHPI
ncbi:MAG: hypothetical protein TR69_WS6001000240 [candidate division WS6 bacterium OLB20]|uniref:Uncharacterized protein n=1 Tax=candidate division WS6 bacterium OLB20 TaxID=1617426 RepID=A0A136M0D9_9BACT|nr:MAG: hypothetical protein TR69_WS6001000240 [candidate division WS6 bacterium OLB20]